MIRSMTGFGEAEADTAAGRLRVEVRSVNHRFFSANLRLARAVERHEPAIREWLRERMPRGHVHCTVRLESGGNGGAAVRADADRARQYVEALQSLKRALDLRGEVDLPLIARFGDVLVTADEEAVEVAVEDLRAVVAAAAEAAVAMRDDEGRRLAEDLVARLDAMAAALAGIEMRAPERMLVERDRVRRVVTELLEGIPLDEERVAREIAYLAERWDVSEELVRLRAHMAVFRELIAAPAGEPVGKRMGFLIQEMNREANTIGSKANDAPIEHGVVAVKDEIERLREQVENVE